MLVSHVGIPPRRPWERAQSDVVIGSGGTRVEAITPGEGHSVGDRGGYAHLTPDHGHRVRGILDDTLGRGVED